MLAQGICSDFRKLIERSVEEDLLNKVVLRHRRSITTDNRLHAVQDIELRISEHRDRPFRLIVTAHFANA